MNNYHLELSIPGLPQTTNQKRRGGHSHWTQQLREANIWKRSILPYLVNKKPPEPLQRAKLVLTRCSSNEPDYDGLVSSFKHLIDGLVEAGVLANDKRENIGIPDYCWEKAPKKAGFIKIIIESIGENNAK